MNSRLPFDIVRAEETVWDAARTAIVDAAYAGVRGAFYEGGLARAPRWAVWLLTEAAYRGYPSDVGARRLAALSEEQQAVLVCRAVLLGGGEEVMKREFPWWEELP